MLAISLTAMIFNNVAGAQNVYGTLQISNEKGCRPGFVKDTKTEGNLIKHYQVAIVVNYKQQCPDLGKTVFFFFLKDRTLQLPPYRENMAESSTERLVESDYKLE